MPPWENFPETVENELVKVGCRIHNGRGSKIRLDSHGFQLIDGLQGKLSPLQSDDHAFKKDAENVAMELTGASFGFAYCSARRTPKVESSNQAGYAGYVHTDLAQNSWIMALPELVASGKWEAHGPPGISNEAAASIAKASRVAVVSLWRYLGPAQTCKQSHLAFLDPRSLQREDVLDFAIGTVKGTSGSNYRLSADSAKTSEHVWWYFPDLDRDSEMVGFTAYDSASEYANNDATKTPSILHAAFMDPQGTNEPPRSSVDVRVLLAWP
jgi:hypothetical protein